MKSIEIKEIMKLPISEREEAFEKEVEAAVGEFDTEWLGYLTHKQIVKIINKGGSLKDIENAVKTAKKSRMIKDYVIIPAIVIAIVVVFGLL